MRPTYHLILSGNHYDAAVPEREANLDVLAAAALDSDGHVCERRTNLEREWKASSDFQDCPRDGNNRMQLRGVNGYHVDLSTCSGSTSIHYGQEAPLSFPRGYFSSPRHMIKVQRLASFATSGCSKQNCFSSP
eukprot:Rmarinus@m.29740